MERYAKRIIRNLQNQIIKGTYNPQEGLVYGLSDSPFGDIYCIYRLEKDILTCFTLFEPEVSDKVEREVLRLVILYNFTKNQHIENQLIS